MEGIQTGESKEAEFSLEAVKFLARDAERVREANREGAGLQWGQQKTWLHIHHPLARRGSEKLQV